MTDDEFDASLVDAAFSLGAAEGWRNVSAASAARNAGLDISRARLRFPFRGAVLKRFGQFADAYALTGAMAEGTVRDKLFDLLLRRFDFLQKHREGVIALLRVAPLDPGLSAWLGCETLKSMGWLLEGAGVSSQGVRGTLRKRGLAAVWAWGLRAWLRDESEDLSATMAAVDVALRRADQVAERFNTMGRAAGPAGDGFTPETTADAPETEPAASEPPLGSVDDPPPPGVPPPGVPGI